ncbi:hypothetical protein K493DRAFT_308921 [Basidiobolus meristosporus CBS 931.73]|uniref:Uncharacterized protein n=1 Tax=Basidiobolus meristosporus CBS 931.73 TaxID=1314790 RepID=A0A1Y1WV89_9FUNG|nr:hypothetical protein K493DRAFT_308921 [Basidiobolus meristosporus CBS 931.73]|eukprot:ORX77218.1 hypothetical protein K493DRAFT_308921 [Basidiobolus meristosporus CBS 931.73]
MAKNHFQVEPRKNTQELAATLQTFRAEFKNGSLTVSEFISAYIILFTANKRPNKWLTGKLNPTIEYELSWLYPEMQNATAASLCKYQDELGISPQDLSRLRKMLPKGDSEKELTFTDVFKYAAVYGVERYVNQAIVNLALGSPTIHLLFHIPSAVRVLKFQAEGSRIVTCFLKATELEQILTDTYPPYESRDVVGFMIHDLKHLQAFFEPSLYFEQVGFAHCLASTLEYPGLREFFSDPYFAADFDHCISDMNSASIHLLSFLKAKWISAFHRSIYPPPCTKLRLDDDEHELFEVRYWKPLLSSWGMPQAHLDHCWKICKPQFSQEDKLAIRRWFHELGCQLMNRHAEFVVA